MVQEKKCERIYTLRGHTKCWQVVNWSEGSGVAFSTLFFKLSNLKLFRILCWGKEPVAGRVPRLLSLIPLTPDPWPTGTPFLSSPTAHSLGDFILTSLPSTPSFSLWVGAAGARWVGQPGQEQQVEAGLSPPCCGPRDRGWPGSPSYLWRRVPDGKRRNPSIVQKLFLTTFHIPSFFKKYFIYLVLYYFIYFLAGG